jgi:hypothetical protein
MKSLPRSTRLSNIARWIVVRAAVAAGLGVAAILILIQAARSHFPVVLFAAILVVALVSYVFSRSDRQERDEDSGVAPEEQASDWQDERRGDRTEPRRSQAA